MKVYNVLENSPYKSIYKGYTFVFSSIKHKEKFDNSINEFIDEQRSRYSWKLKCNVADSELILVLVLYRTIETRGFYVYCDSGVLPSDYSIKMSLL